MNEEDRFYYNKKFMAMHDKIADLETVAFALQDRVAELEVKQKKKRWFRK